MNHERELIEHFLRVEIAICQRLADLETAVKTYGDTIMGQITAIGDGFDSLRQALSDSQDLSTANAALVTANTALVGDVTTLLAKLKVVPPASLPADVVAQIATVDGSVTSSTTAATAATQAAQAADASAQAIVTPAPAVATVIPAPTPTP
jgi:hypothetical protein